MKGSTLKQVKLCGPHFFCLQESRNAKISSSPSYQIYLHHHSMLERSGGIIIGIHNSFASKDISDILQIQNQIEFDYLIINARNEYFDIFVFNFYFNKNSTLKKLQIPLSNWLKQFISSIKPNQQIIVCGDFNTQQVPFDFLVSALPLYINTFKRKRIKKVIQSRSDHVLSHPSVQHNFKNSFNQLSDHSLIELELNLEPKVNQQFYFFKFNKKRAQNLNNLASSKFSDFTCFYKFIQNNLRKSKVIQKIKKQIIPKLSTKSMQGNQIYFNFWPTYSKMIKQNSIMPQKKQLFQIPLKKKVAFFLTILMILANFNLETLQSIIVLNNFTLFRMVKKFRPLKLPSLPPLDTLNLIELQSRMSYNKAISYDGISDNFIRNCKNVKNFCDIWNQSTIHTNQVCCRARLVPLNKVFPDIPNKSQFRPITILSPLFKLLELRFLPKLQFYLSTQLSKGQAGFIPNSSTQINIVRLLNNLVSFKKEDKMNCIFIDFSNAFNSINRQKLFKILSAKAILDKIEIKFLKRLYTNLHYICPQTNSTFYFENGVPQGSPLSPALFNIYLDDFLSALKHNCNFNSTSYEFADDIVIFIDHKNTLSFLQQLIIISEQYELKVNQKKCGIFFIKNHKYCKQKYLVGFPIVKTYRYLGVNINNNGKINLQLDKIQQTLKFLTGKLLWISQKLNWKQKYQLFQTFMLPHIIYICPSIPTQKYKNVLMHLEKLYKSTFKKVCGFSKCLPNEILDLLLPSLDQIIAKHTKKTIQKLNNGNFGQTSFINDYFIQIQEVNQKPIYKSNPNNFNSLFSLYPQICKSHQCNLSYRHIINYHSSFHTSEFIMNLRNIAQAKFQSKKYCNRLEKIIAQFLTD